MQGFGVEDERGGGVWNCVRNSWKRLVRRKFGGVWEKTVEKCGKEECRRKVWKRNVEVRCEEGLMKKGVGEGLMKRVKEGKVGGGCEEKRFCKKVVQNRNGEKEKKKKVVFGWLRSGVWVVEEWCLGG